MLKIVAYKMDLKSRLDLTGAITGKFQCVTESKQIATNKAVVSPAEWQQGLVGPDWDQQK